MLQNFYGGTDRHKVIARVPWATHCRAHVQPPHGILEIYFPGGTEIVHFSELPTNYVYGKGTGRTVAKKRERGVSYAVQSRCSKRGRTACSPW